MSAQYRPYRDEESVDGLEATSWTDHEPGSIQIYEKTTEELPLSSTNRRALWTHIALLSTVGLLGFLLGYFVELHPMCPSTDSQSIDSDSSSDQALHDHTHFHFNPYEDPTIKDKLLNNINGNNILETLTTYKDTNRIPGSETDHKFARHVYQSFQTFGFDRVSLTNNTFRTMLPSRPSVVTILDKNQKAIYSTANENYPHDDMRPFLPLSQANETFITTNQLLYVNTGSKEDYEKLESLKIHSNETENKVFVIRQTFYQVHNIVIQAQESGAKAILLFPDPYYYGSESPFPELVRLPNDAARSHPTAWSNYGDLAVLNLSSVGLDASNLGIDREARVRIPVIPISFESASKILFGLSGESAPIEWNCFEFTLHIGPGYKEKGNEDQRESIKIEFSNQETAVTSPTVTGIIRGSVEPDRYIIIGSRRDSLNRGLLDSVSGTAVMLEIGRVFGYLLNREKWRPRRTIIFNSFGAESLNLLDSSNWLETHQRLLHSRAVCYLNCDQIVTGNATLRIAASPLLYQVIYNATKQVTNPNIDEDPSNLKSTYDSWLKSQDRQKDSLNNNRFSDAVMEALFNNWNNFELEHPEPMSMKDEGHDNLGKRGTILKEYVKSADVGHRPRIRRPDLHSIYSPFLLYAGVPVVDVRYAAYRGVNNKTSFIEDMTPVIGSKYDNYAAVQRIDPHLKYHVAVGQVLSEMVRDLSDSVFLPFNLLDYAATLNDSFNHLAGTYNKTFSQSDIDLEPLRGAIQDFTRAAIKFHHRQDQVDLRYSLSIRKFNDQMMLLERSFADPNVLPGLTDRKHLILSPHDGGDHTEGFPVLVDWITLLESDSENSVLADFLKLNFKAVVYTISNAVRIIEDVLTL